MYMTEPQDHDEIENETESFAALLDSYDARLRTNLQVGDKICGKIISIGKDTVFVDTGSKVDGAVDAAELLDGEGNLPFKTGDEIDLYVVAIDEGEIRLSKAISGMGGFNLLMEAYDRAVPVQGKVKETCKGGFYIDVLERRAFCPISQIDIRQVENPEEYIGQTFEFLIIQLEEKGRNIVVSRRKLLEKELEKLRKDFFEQLTIGARMDGQVTKIMPFGAFVSLSPGVEGLIHISELSWSKTQKPEDVIGVGDHVNVKVLGFEQNAESGRGKISLSLKHLTGDPWLEVDHLFKPGDKISGKVTRLMKFGAFVEISPGIEGLVHLSEMSYFKRVIKPEDVLSPGDIVSVAIKEVDPGARRISLSLKDAEKDPWADIETKYEIGTEVNGILEKKEAFGLFILLEPGVTGLMPKSKLAGAAGSGSLGKLKEGDGIAVIVDAIDAASRKITLSPSDLRDETNWKNFSRTESATMGSLGEKLKSALQSHKR
jgi:small subunit ribosomal protein S1